MKRAFCIFALASFASAGDLVDEDWAAKDVAVARRIVAALPAGETNIDDFLKKLDASSTDEDRGIGFGARRLRLALYGGHTTTWVTVIAWNDRVGPIEVFCCEGDAEVWAELRERIAAEYKGREPAIGEKGLRVRVGKAWEPEGFQDERGKILGAHLLIDPADDVAEAYLLLLSPFSDLAYGSMQGEGGDKPDGRLAMEKILAHEQGASLLEDALRGPNPEGRLYAAEGLLRLERKGRKLGEQARKDIEWVRKSDVKIHACRGCEMSWEPAAMPLEEMLKDGA